MTRYAPDERPAQGDCRPSCASLRFRDAECVCADLDALEAKGFYNSSFDPISPYFDIRSWGPQR